MFEEPNRNTRRVAVIGGRAGWNVIAASTEVHFSDGTQLAFHRVAVGESTHRWLRAVLLVEQWLVFDVRQVCAETAADMLAAHWLDQYGCFYYGLRTRWSGSNSLLLVIYAQQLNTAAEPQAANARELEPA